MFPGLAFEMSQPMSQDSRGGLAPGRQRSTVLPVTTILRFSATGLALGIAAIAPHANEAQVVLHCESVRLRPSAVDQAGIEWRLEASTLSDGTINDEIWVSDEGPYMHGTVLFLTEGLSADPLRLECQIEVPDPGDSNLNGLSDFFEVALSVTDLASVGEFLFGDGAELYQGLVDMTWTRAAGETAGTCQLRLRILDYGVDLTFPHTFEISDYRGVYAYETDGVNVFGTVSLARQGAAGTLRGPLLFERLDYFELAFPAFALEDELERRISFFGSWVLDTSLLRGVLRDNYYTVLYTQDGWPATPNGPEYEVWNLHLFDPNDSDRDGIPDLSDDPPPPRLSIGYSDKRLQIGIRALHGQQVTLEAASAVVPSSWTVVDTVVLAGATHTFEIETPSGPRFWRARIE